MLGDRLSATRIVSIFGIAIGVYFGVLGTAVNGQAVSAPADRESSDTSAYVQTSLGGLNFRIPRQYFDIGLGSSGFRLRMDLRFILSGHESSRPGRRAMISVTLLHRGQPQAVDYVRALIRYRISAGMHNPSVLSSSVDGDGDGTTEVPEGLAYYLALPESHTASGIKQDLFIPIEYVVDGGVSSNAIEAVFCLSLSSIHIQLSQHARSDRPCRAFEFTEIYESKLTSTEVI